MFESPAGETVGGEFATAAGEGVGPLDDVRGEVVGLHRVLMHTVVFDKVTIGPRTCRAALLVLACATICIGDVSHGGDTRYAPCAAEAVGAAGVEFFAQFVAPCADIWVITAYAAVGGFTGFTNVYTDLRVDVQRPAAVVPDGAVDCAPVELSRPVRVTRVAHIVHTVRSAARAVIVVSTFTAGEFTVRIGKTADGAAMAGDDFAVQQVLVTGEFVPAHALAVRTFIRVADAFVYPVRVVRVEGRITHHATATAIADVGEDLLLTAIGDVAW